LRIAATISPSRADEIGQAVQSDQYIRVFQQNCASSPDRFKMTSYRLESTTIGVDGPLFVRRYLPIQGAATRQLVVVHGAGEHSGRYEHFISRAVACGWCVVAGDLRGHGRSSGVPTHLDDFEHYLTDLDAIWRHFELRSETTALFGHSLGGLIAARYAQSRPGNLAALVLSSPLLGFGVRVPRLKRTFGRVCLLVAPRTRFRTTIRPEQVTRNEHALLIREQDPLSNRTVTAGWYFRVLDALFDAWSDAARLEAPLLLLQGDADSIVNAEAPLRWFPTAGARDKSLLLLPGHLHELLNEPEWEETSERILTWLGGRIAARPAGDEVAHGETAPNGVPWIVADSVAAGHAAHVCVS
jgi:lysophospholipase